MNVKKVPVDDFTVVMTLSPEDADNLYNNIVVLLRAVGVHSALDRARPAGKGYEAIYALFDSLYSVGVNGAGRAS